METKILIRVRGYHEDRFGHVNHARYLELLEEARWAHLDERGLDHAFFSRHGVFPVVAGLTISYRRPASTGDQLEILSSTSDVGSRKMVIHQEARFMPSEKVCVEADVTVVFVDAKTGRAAPITQDFLDAWKGASNQEPPQEDDGADPLTW